MMKRKLRSYYSFCYEAMEYYNLSHDDELILDSIYSIASSTKSYSMRLKDNNGKLRTYYWVKYSRIIEEYNGEIRAKGPLKVTLPQTLGRRIKSMADKGILHYRLMNCRTTPEGRTDKGNYTYIAIDEIAFKFLMGGDKPYFRMNSSSAHRVMGLKDTDPLDPTVHTKILTSQDINNLSQQSEENDFPLPMQDHAKDINCSGKEKDSHLLEHKVAEQLQVATQLPVTERGTVANKLSGILTSIGGYCTDSLVERTMEAAYSKGFTTTQEICAYLDYVLYNMKSNKSIRNAPRYFIKAATVCIYGASFLEQYRKKQEVNKSGEETQPVLSQVHPVPEDYVSHTVTCPVCSGKYNVEARICNNCGLTDPSSSQDMETARKTFALSSSVREELLYRLNHHTMQTMFHMDKDKVKAQRKAIYAEYGIEVSP